MWRKHPHVALQAIAARSRDGVVCCDSSGKPLWWNTAATRYFLSSSREAVSTARRLDDLLCADPPDRLLELVEAGQGRTRLEVETMSAGDLAVEVTAHDLTPWFDRDGEEGAAIRVLLLRPVSGGRDEEVGNVLRLFAVLLHGIKNALASIKLLAQGAQLEMAVQGNTDTESQLFAGYLQRIDMEVDRSVAYLDSVRFMLTPPSGRAGRFSVVPVVRSVLEALRPAMERIGMDARVVVDGPLPQIHASVDDFRQVVHNLVDRARESIRRSGRPGLLEVRLFGEGEFVRLAFQDNGIPLEPEVLARLSRREYASSREDLPLLVVQWIIEYYRGRIECRIDDSERTVVHVWFPASLPKPVNRGAA